jgi:hypothetical protein
MLALWRNRIARYAAEQGGRPSTASQKKKN